MGGRLSGPGLKSPLLDTGGADHPVQIVMFGLENAGTKDLLPHFCLGESHLTIPRIGVNVEAIELEQLTLYSWEICDQSNSNRTWDAIRVFMEGYDVAIFVVDSADQETLSEAREGMVHYLDRARYDTRERETLLLIYATRQDNLRAVDVSDIRDAFRPELMARRKWRVQGCETTTGKGVFEGLEWVAAQLRETNV